MGILADVFGVPTARNVGGGGASLGAAICAAVATGVHADFDTAAALMAAERGNIRSRCRAHLHLPTA